MKNEVLQTVRGKKHPTANKKDEGTLDWLHLKQNCLVTHVTEGKTKVTEDKEEEISSYWIVLTKQDARNLKRKH